MENKKIVIAGGTGFIGQEMIKYWGKKNEIIILSRQLPHSANNRNKYDQLSQKELGAVRFAKWDGKNPGDWINETDGADIIINLTGKSVNCRYNAGNKKEILDSRLNAVKAIGMAVAQCKRPAKLWVNASSATIYRHATDRPQDEYTGEFHDDFSVSVCKQWEAAFFEQSVPVTRKVALRMAITLGPGGVLIPYFNLLKSGLGGRQGSGKQIFSWIHIEDSCRMIEWMEKKEELNGVYNCSSPLPVSNSEFMKALRKATGKSFGLPAFTWMLKTGAAIIGTETELVLKSRWVLPTKILATGFQFKHPMLQNALDDIISKVPRRQYQLF